jgi:hypothetical protein
MAASWCVIVLPLLLLLLLLLLLPCCCCLVVALQALTELSIADNMINQLPEDLSALTALRKAHFYGNQLRQLPMGPQGLPALYRQPADGSNAGSNGSSNSSSSGSSGAPLLSSLWLEANPLSEEAVLQLLDLADAVAGSSASSKKGGKQPRIGLDDSQLSGSALSVWRQQQERGCTIVRRGIVKVRQMPGG